MRVKAEIAGKDLVSNIKFYGDTRYDNEVTDEIKELSKVLGDVFWGLNHTQNQVEGRTEHSAQEISKELKQLRRDVLWIMCGPEDVDTLKELLHEYEEDTE